MQHARFCLILPASCMKFASMQLQSRCRVQQAGIFSPAASWLLLLSLVVAAPSLKRTAQRTAEKSVARF